MLVYLHVKNIAIIDEEEIEFREGLNILTGETGAGKSVILGALALTMGAKTPSSVIRDEGVEAFAEAVFTLSPYQKQRLIDMEIDIEDDEIILQRKVTPQRISAKINGQSVPAVKLTRAASFLIDIYGQHEQQTLLSRKNHMQLLDDYAGIECKKLKEDLKNTYSLLLSLERKREEEGIDENERLRQIDLIEHEINQIELTDPRPGEDGDLKEEYVLLSKKEKIIDKVRSARNDLDSGLMDTLGRALRQLGLACESDEGLNDIIDSLSDAESIINTTIRYLADYEDEAGLSYERLDEISKRIDQIDILKRKFSKDGSIEDIFKTLSEHRQTLEKYRDYENYIRELERQLKNIEDEYYKLAEKLTNIRKVTAKALSEELTSALYELNFIKPEVEVEVKPTGNISENGVDDVIFNISTNPGEKLKPVNEIASGGELSRIMLALKTIFASQGEIDTLVFDEIDAGISGQTASRVADRLSALSCKNQVICITHLPQIAAKADYHYLIKKTVANDRTVSGINLLDETEHIKEVARMMSADEINDAAIENARALIRGDGSVS